MTQAQQSEPPSPEAVTASNIFLVGRKRPQAIKMVSGVLELDMSRTVGKAPPPPPVELDAARERYAA